MKKLIYILLFLSFLPIFSQNQEFNIDSLIDNLPNLNETDRINDLNKITTLLWKVDKERSLKYAKKALELSTEIDYKKGIADALSNLGILAMYDNDQENAILYLNKSLNQLKELNDTNAITKLYINISALYYNSGNIDKAIEYNIEAINRLHKYPFDINKDLALATLYNNLSLCYISKNEYKKALDYINKSLELKIKTKDKGIANVYGNLGLIYKSMKKIDSAIFYYKKSINLLEQNNDEYGKIISYMNLGEIYTENNKLDSAEFYLQKALDLSLKLNMYNYLIETYKAFSELYTKKNDYKKALEFYVKSTNYKDSVSNSEMYSEIEKIEKKYHETQIEKDKEIKRIKEKKNKIVKYSLISIILVIILLIAVLYNKYKYKTKSEQKLKQLNHEKDKFFSILAHDLRSPFQAFLTLTDIMANSFRDLKPEEVHDYAKRINETAVRVNNLLENLLEWSVSQTGSRTYTFELFNLYKAADRSIKLLFNNAIKKNIEIVNKIDENIFVYADKNSVKTIFRNLINNAIKFTPPNGEIIIDAVDKGKFVEISVSDNGIGISKENLDKIFKIDQNFSTLGTEKEKGTGLGLILVKEFVEKNGGEITVKSEEGKGTSFIFTLKKSENG